MAVAGLFTFILALEPVTVGSGFLEPLVQAIFNRRVIDLEYQSFRSEKPSHHILHPYYLKEYRNRWYLLAYHDHFREVYVYGLDRVKRLGMVHGKKFIETDFDIADYFRHHVLFAMARKLIKELKLFS